MDLISHTEIIGIVGLLFAVYSFLAGLSMRASNKVGAQLAKLLTEDHVHRAEYERALDYFRKENEKIYAALENSSNRIVKLDVSGACS